MTVKDMGLVVVAARCARGYTQRSFAKKYGWSQSKVSRVENGKNGVSLADVLTMLDQLNILIILQPLIPER